MFMFRSRRSNLTKRLLKERKKRTDETQRAFENDTVGVETLIKKLQENQLEMLCTTVVNRGHDLSNCVLLPRDHHPHVLCCQTWRWPDLRQNSELRRHPACRSACDPFYICCNPYHWSRIYQIETPPPPYSRYDAMDRLRPEDRAPSEAPLVRRDSFPGSVTTNGEDSTRNPREWCKLAYWELDKRVGPLLCVDMPAVNIFGNIPYGDGLSLETLAQHIVEPSVIKTRCKIGLGITLSRENNCIWVYNRSDNPIFVNSLTLENADLPSPTRVPAEHCLCIFDPTEATHLNNNWNYINGFGPIDRNSIRISFVKGWGPGYARQEITSCHCWIEILLSPCR